MDLRDNALTGQDVQVPADRHVRDAERARELVDADTAAPAYLVQNQRARLVNQGASRGDDLATATVDAPLGTTLSAVLGRMLSA